jgi:hypothetical protein
MRKTTRVLILFFAFSLELVSCQSENTNPLKNLKALDSPEGVVLRGRWIPQNEINSTLKQIEAIYNPPLEKQILSEASDVSILKLVEEIKSLSAQGFVFRTQ